MREKEKVITLEDRIPKLKEQRRQKANRRLILYISIFFFLILIIVYLISPLSHVGKVTINGNHYVDNRTILDASGLSSDTSFWDVDRDAVVKKVKKVKEVKSVSVNKHFPNAVSIRVTEYGRVAYLKKDDRYYPILENGARLSALSQKDIPAGAPILVDWEDGKKLAHMAGELQKLPEAMVHRISEIYYTPTEHFPGAITVYMNDGFEVQSLINNFSNKMKSYPDIVSQLNPQARGIIHMRVGTYFEKYGNDGMAASKNKK
jgi:cell division protein FtsQ